MSTNIVNSNVTAFNRHRRLAAERARAEAEVEEAAARTEKAASEKAPQTPVQLSVRMTKAQLLAIAEERGVVANEDMTKTQIVDLLEPEEHEEPEGGE